MSLRFLYDAVTLAQELHDASFRKLPRAAGLALVLQPALARADLFEEIKARGVIRIATIEQLPYFEHKKEQPPRGFIVDLADRLARTLKVRPELKTSKPQELLQHLKGGEVDLVAGGLPFTVERTLEVTFSPPISRTRVDLLTRTKPSRWKSNLDAPVGPGSAIAVVAGSEAAAAADAAFPDGACCARSPLVTLSPP